VLVVDDSVVIRRLLCDVISSDEQLEVVGYAANGQIAMAMLDRVCPDIVTLDVEMPEMDGLETLKAIRSRHKCLPVIMFSTLTERGAATTIDALSAGASDYITKPANVGSFGESKEQIRHALIPKIKALCGIAVSAAAKVEAVPCPAPVRRRKIVKTDRIDAVVIGCSTGGPNALAEILPALPANFPVPILVVQHMPPAFTHFLAQRLDKYSPLEVQEALPGAEIAPGMIWIAPGDYHMTIEFYQNEYRIGTNQHSPENSCRPSVDVLFASAARTFGGNVLAVVLTGMGQDGLHGCERLADCGAQIVVQNEATSVVWGMPGYVANAGLADAVLPLSEIALEINRRVGANRLTPRMRGAS